MKKEVLIFVYIVWAMLVGHRVWIWRNLKEDGWQGGGMPFLPVGGDHIANAGMNLASAEEAGTERGLNYGGSAGCGEGPRLSLVGDGYLW